MKKVLIVVFLFSFSFFFLYFILLCNLTGNLSGNFVNEASIYRFSSNLERSIHDIPKNNIKLIEFHRSILYQGFNLKTFLDINKMSNIIMYENTYKKIVNLNKLPKENEKYLKIKNNRKKLIAYYKFKDKPYYVLFLTKKNGQIYKGRHSPFYFKSNLNKNYKTLLSME